MNDEQINALLQHLRDCCDDVSSAANNAIKFGLLNGSCVTDDSKDKRLADAMIEFFAAMDLLSQQGYLNGLTEDTDVEVRRLSAELKARLM